MHGSVFATRQKKMKSFSKMLQERGGIIYEAGAAGH
jgi:hypothetical protein